MAFSTISWTSMDDFITQMDSFLVANGWTQDDLDLPSDEAAWNKGTIFVQVEWDNINRLTMHQSLSHNGSAPGFNPDDAGPDSGPEQEMLWSNGPGTADFFSGTEQGSEFFFAAIEFSPNRYCFLGMGSLIKKGTWTGGEWSAISQWGIGGGIQNIPNDIRHYILFDGQNSGNDSSAKLHAEGWPNQVAARKWGQIQGIFTGTPANDRAGNPRDVYAAAGIREGYNFNAFQYLAFQPNAGFVPLQPVEIWRREDTPFRLAGFVPGFRGLNITNIDVREELLVGAATWRCYPWALKGNVGSYFSGLDGGMAFLKT